MKILVVGRGMAAHGLAWKLSQSPGVAKVLVAPGTSGTASEGRVENLPIWVKETEALAQAAKTHGVDFTVVGPAVSLNAGITDVFASHGLKIFGPTRAATILERSKTYAKEFMRRYGIATPDYASFSGAAAAKSFVYTRDAPIVIRVDSPGPTPGATVAKTHAEAALAIDQLFEKYIGDTPSAKMLIERFMRGAELSFTVMVDDHAVVPLPDSRNYRRLFDGDNGPNTEGMGACSPVPLVDDRLSEKILHKIVYPTVHGMASEGLPYKGFLYFGVIVDQTGEPYVLDFKTRLGLPEALTMLVRMQSDFADLLRCGVNNELKRATPLWSPTSAVTVVVATPGYPTPEKRRDPIVLPPETPGSKIFHGETAVQDGKLVTDGWRILGITGTGKTLEDARNAAYGLVRGVHFPDMQYRRDIGR